MFFFFQNVRFRLFLLFLLVQSLSFVGCGGFDIGIYTRVHVGSSLSVKLNAVQPLVPAGLKAKIDIDFVQGSAGAGEIVLVGAMIQYCVPRQGISLVGKKEVSLTQCVHVNGSLTQLKIPSLRLPRKLEQDCYLKSGKASPCFFPGGMTPVSLEVFSDVGNLSPSSKDWKDSQKVTTIETLAGGNIATTYKAGPCNHPDFIDLLVYVRFRDEPDTLYATRTNGTTTTLFSQSSSKAVFKLSCE